MAQRCRSAGTVALDWKYGLCGHHPADSEFAVGAAGVVFGTFYGTLYAVIRGEIGAILCFLIARVLGREALSRFMNTEASFCQKCTDHQLPDQPVRAPAP